MGRDTINAMIRSAEIRNWDIIHTPERNVVITTPPLPRPRAVLTGSGDIVIGTDGLAMVLAQSAHLSRLMAQARTIVIAECDEHIVRETLVRHIAIINALREDEDDRYAA